MLAQLPPELADLARQFDRAMARIHLRIGARAIMWGRPQIGAQYFELAAAEAAELDEEYLRLLAHQLLLFSRRVLVTKLLPQS